MLIERIAMLGLTAAAEAAGVSLRTARKWLERLRLGGLTALADRSSRPRRVRGSLEEAQLRRWRMPMRRIAELVGQRFDRQPSAVPAGSVEPARAQSGDGSCAMSM